ncbi:hypothetical protein ABIC83_002501 [Roseateles asaccharophilus]|uniref:ADP-ribosyltransferase-containing protein n=1 Tax=Roseateles asaccharophilus TaxID=582607 RepID=UPI003837803D
MTTPVCPLDLVDRLAPNGRSVAANFKDWFRDSKVVDSKGRPLVVYHGTDQDFAAFDKGCIGNNFRADEKGFFFTSSQLHASNYAENDTVGLNKRLGAMVMPVYISLQRPLIIDDAFLQSEGMEPIGISEDTVSFWDVYQGLILEWAQKKRADGIILVNNRYLPNGGREPERMVVAFEPRQIKSALGNSGLYAPFSDELHDFRPGPTAEAVVKSKSRRSIPA